MLLRKCVYTDDRVGPLGKEYRTYGYGLPMYSSIDFIPFPPLSGRGGRTGVPNPGP